MARNEKTVLVGCRLPHGIILEHPLNPLDRVQLKGLNEIVIIGQTHGTTHVDADFMEQWLLVNKEFGPLKSGAIFVAKNDGDLLAKAVENAKARTGFEPMRTDGKDERAAGAKQVTEKD